MTPTALTTSNAEGVTRTNPRAKPSADTSRPGMDVIMAMTVSTITQSLKSQKGQI